MRGACSRQPVQRAPPCQAVQPLQWRAQHSSCLTWAWCLHPRPLCCALVPCPAGTAGRQDGNTACLVSWLWFSQACTHPHGTIRCRQGIVWWLQNLQCSMGLVFLQSGTDKGGNGRDLIRMRSDRGARRAQEAPRESGAAGRLLPICALSDYPDYGIVRSRAERSCKELRGGITAAAASAARRTRAHSTALWPLTEYLGVAQFDTVQQVGFKMAPLRHGAATRNRDTLSRKE